MKTHSFYLLVAGAAGMLAVAAPISGQNAVRPAPVAEVDPRVQALIDQLAAQNKQLVANQTAMEAQIDDLAETIRVSRIMASRAGGKKW